MKRLSVFYRAVNVFTWKVKGKFPEFLINPFIKLYFHGVQKWLKHYFSYLLPMTSQDLKEQNGDENIWVCWLQGYENAPAIVKTCIDSVRKNAGNHKVILLNEKNMLDYVDLPDYIIQKYRNGIIPIQNFSDILRFALLKQRGGCGWTQQFLLPGKYLILFLRESSGL